MFKPSEREEEQSIRRGDLIAFTPVLDGLRLRRGFFFLGGGFFSFARSWGWGFYSRLGLFFNGVASLTAYRTGRYVRLGTPRCGSRARPCALCRRYASRDIARRLYRPFSAGFGGPGRQFRSATVGSGSFRSAPLRGGFSLRLSDGRWNVARQSNFNFGNTLTISTV